MSEGRIFVKSLLEMFLGRSLRVFRSIGHLMVVLGASMWLIKILIIFYKNFT